MDLIRNAAPLRTGCSVITSDLLPRRGCFSLTPRWTGSTTAGTAFVGIDLCDTAWSETMSLASYHDSMTGVRGCGSTAAWSPTKLYCIRLSPTKASGRFAPVNHRGVNEKQPLRGNTFVVMITGSVRKDGSIRKSGSVRESGSVRRNNAGQSFRTGFQNSLSRQTFMTGFQNSLSRQTFRTGFQNRL